MIDTPSAPSPDEWLFGWDPTPGIVSVWADWRGHALVWQRQDNRLSCHREYFRPWLYARHLDDLAHLKTALRPGDPQADLTYRVLPGPAEAYRYLLEARDGRVLKRAILTGASRRCGRPISSLHGLDDYYQVGPVEQYLMRTGRVYFRGLTFKELHRLQFDLETTALEPERGRIFLVAVRDNHGLETTLEAATDGEEARLIRELCALVQQRDPDVIENHNLMGFDLPFLEARGRALGVPLNLGRPEGPGGLQRVSHPRGSHRYTLAGRELLDTLDAVRRHDFIVRDLPSHRLKDVARYFGVAAAERVYLPGREVAATFSTAPELVRRYALADVAEVDALAERLLTPAFALAGMTPRRYERVATAGPATGILEPMLVRAYLYAGAALPCVQEPASGGTLHLGGAVHLFAEGVAERVVKADIASLYPSLMRAFRIGLACDPMNVLLSLVERLTNLRLAHKDATRGAVPGSVEAGHHAAMQAAMKLVINAAYGYLGAGSMALFADQRAADEITRRGREVLDQVLVALRARGVALIEADTDGVFFAVPPDWDEAQERAVVAAIGATLADGLHLEFDGRYRAMLSHEVRYRAMLSHEVKNYALLGYDGRLTVRGGAFRSSRTEPFGERFLQAALRAVLEGDVAGAQRVYLETERALRERAVPTRDVATRVRLTKAPQVYLRDQAKRREPAYEALLSAGRDDWSPGEQVRFYRAVGGKFVWLPEAESGDTDPRDYDVPHYLKVLVASYVSRLRKAFTHEDFEQLFRRDGQNGLFDRPLDSIAPRRISVG